LICNPHDSYQIKNICDYLNSRIRKKSHFPINQQKLSGLKKQIRILHNFTATFINGYF